MAKLPKTPETDSRDQTESVAPTRPMKVFAGNCPTSPRHINTKVYRTVDKIRYCVCHDCGATWKQSGPASAAP
jgi:hypothetical protein